MKFRQTFYIFGMGVEDYVNTQLSGSQLVQLGGEGQNITVLCEFCRLLGLKMFLRTPS